MINLFMNSILSFLSRKLIFNICICFLLTYYLNKTNSQKGLRFLILPRHLLNLSYYKEN